MKLNIRSMPFVALGLAVSSVARGQLTIDNRVLTVPQVCAMTMSQQPVLKKLNLNSAQTAAYMHAVKTYIAESQKLENSKTATDSERNACDIKYANACLNVLNPVQKHLLLQSGIPRIGSIALTDPTVVTQVGLQQLQVQKVKEICTAFAKDDEDVSAMIANAVEKIPEPKAGTDRKKYETKCAQVASMYNGERQRIAKEKVDSDKRILALLTPAQRSKWLDLAGPLPTK